jgi:hypothetical protein
MGRGDYLSSTQGGYTYSQPAESSSYSSGNGGSTDGNGSSIENKGTGTTGHSILDALNKLKAEGKGDTEQAKVYERYLVGVEQKYQSEGKSLYGDVYGPELHKPTLSSEDIVNQLAALEAGDPFDPENKYFKSFAGQEFHDYWLDPKQGGLTKDDPILKEKWISEFGMPSIVATKGWGDPIETAKYTDEYGQKIPGGEYIYTGLGKTMMDQLEGSVAGTQLFGGDIEAYQQSKDAYWDDRAAQESINQSQRTSWGGYDGGGGTSSGYYGDPRTGNPVEQMANYYTPQANLQQAMVNVHGTPTVFAKRGGIVSLLGLGE